MSAATRGWCGCHPPSRGRCASLEDVETKLLIDAIVQQTTVLIAQLSTAAGIRAPLAHIADQIFLDLALEIERQGVGRKVVADMFGMALRSYQRRVQRVGESASVRDRTLWEAVYDFVSQRESATRADLDERFRHDAADAVGAVLSDLVASGLLYSTGRGRSSRFRAVGASEGQSATADRRLEGAASLVWVTVFRARRLRLSELERAFAMPGEVLRATVDRLVDEGRLSILADGDDPLLAAGEFVVPVGAEQGWEGAIFDHFSAVANAIAAKVHAGPGARTKDIVGGATLSFDLSAEHPYREQVHGLLERVRAEVNALWEKVEAHNASHPIPEDTAERVCFYFGQNVELAEKPGELEEP